MHNAQPLLQIDGTLDVWLASGYCILADTHNNEKTALVTPFGLVLQQLMLVYTELLVVCV